MMVKLRRLQAHELPGLGRGRWDTAPPEGSRPPPPLRCNRCGRLRPPHVMYRDVELDSFKWICQACWWRRFG